MIGVVIATHSDLALSLIRTAEGIIGTQKSLMGVGLDPSDGLDDIRQKIETAVNRADAGNEGVVILTDMLGGSPSLASLHLARTLPIVVVTGVNLPMILEVLLHREKIKNVCNLAEMLVKKAKKSIIIANKLSRK